jgi:hypothetical protein
MTPEHDRQADTEAREQGESKTEEDREREESWSQGGQDVEEAEHEEPGSGA